MKRREATANNLPVVLSLDEQYSLSGQRLYPVTVDEATSAAGARLGRRLGRRAAVTLWTRNAATLLGAGVPLDRTLAFTAQHAGHDGFADTVRQVRRAVQGGASLADALAQHPRYFDPLFIAMVSAGELSGALDVVFARLSEHVEESAELRSQVRSALLYPALMSVVATVGVIVLLGFVIPRFASVLADVGGTLPLSTRLLLGAVEVEAGALARNIVVGLEGADRGEGDAASAAPLVLHRAHPVRAVFAAPVDDARRVGSHQPKALVSPSQKRAARDLGFREIPYRRTTCEARVASQHVGYAVRIEAS